MEEIRKVLVQNGAFQSRAHWSRQTSLFDHKILRTEPFEHPNFRIHFNAFLMKTIFFFIILSGGLFLSSCSGKKTALKDEVMAIHDSIMPRMSELMKLQETLTQ